jgi:hypothetical protein
LRAAALRTILELRIGRFQKFFHGSGHDSFAAAIH